MPRSPRRPKEGKPKQLPTLSVDKKAQEIKGGMFREPTKHPAKVTVPDLKLG